MPNRTRTPALTQVKMAGGGLFRKVGKMASAAMEEKAVDTSRRAAMGLGPKEFTPPTDVPAVVPGALPAGIPPATKPTPTMSPLEFAAQKIINQQVSRRDVLKRLGSAMANQAMPSPLKTMVNQLMPSPVGLADQVAAEAASTGSSLAEALAAVTARIQAHNQAIVSGIPEKALSGVSHRVRPLREDMAVIPGEDGYDTVTDLIAKQYNRTAPKLTDDPVYIQKLKELQRDKARALKELYKDNIFSDVYPEYKDVQLTREAKKAIPEYSAWAKTQSERHSAHDRAYEALKDFKASRPEADPDNMEAFLRQNTEPKPLSTGWADNPEIKQTYVPGVGHYVEPPGYRDPAYWVPSPKQPLPDELLLHDWLRLMNTTQGGGG